MKRAFVPKLGTFSYFDYQKVEPRLLAYYLAVAPGIKDDTLVRVFTEGKYDVYRAIVAPMFGKTPDTLEEAEYKRGKIQFLSLMYGGGATTIMEQFGLPYKEAKGVVKSFNKAWPQIGWLQESLLESHKRKGYIKTPWGRHLHMEPYGEHKLLNKLIQGSAAHLMKRALIKVDHALGSKPEIRSHMVSVIHDEIMFDGPEDELPLLHYMIPSLMGDEIIERILPLGVDHEVSLTSWADKMDYDEWLAQYGERVNATRHGQKELVG